MKTRIQVEEPERKILTKNWMWQVYLTDEFGNSPADGTLRLWKDRAGYHPVNFLGEQVSWIIWTCDGYLENITVWEKRITS